MPALLRYMYTNLYLHNMLFHYDVCAKMKIDFYQSILYWNLNLEVKTMYGLLLLILLLLLLKKVGRARPGESD